MNGGPPAVALEGEVGDRRILAFEDGVVGRSGGPEAVSALLSLFTLGAEIAMVVGGVVPYVPQYQAIKRSSSTKGFSRHVCLALLVANTLRILFWFGKRYELPLLLQSVLMNVAMMELIRLCVNVEAKRNAERLVVDVAAAAKKKERLFIDFDPNDFWRWTDFQSYVEAVTSFTAAAALLMFLLLRVQPFVEAVGFMAVFTEAALGTPQFCMNHKNKSTYGMSLQMVAMWTCGDVFKTSYFVLRQAPVQFAVCGALQVGVDVAILCQAWIYRHNTVKMKKADVGTHY